MSRCEHPSPIDAIVIDMDATEPVQVHPPPLGGRRVLRQRWAELAYFHWRYPPAEVQRLLPDGVTVDTLSLIHI